MIKRARKAILLLLSAFLLTLAVLGWFEARRVAREYDTRVLKNLTLTAHTLQPMVEEVLTVEGETRAREILEHAGKDDDDLRVDWIVFASEGPNIGLSPDQIATLASGRETSTRQGEGDREELRVFVPIQGSLGKGAAIVLAQSLVEEHALVNRLVRERLAAAAFAVIIALLLLEARGAMAAEADARVKAVEQLRHADRLGTVGTLASGMAHELGTPLGVVNGRAKMIAADPDSSEETRKYALIIAAQAERMAKIMRGLLDFARRSSATKRPSDLRDAARRTVELLLPLAKKHSVETRLAMSNDPIVADVDVDLVEQALANLVVNGVQAMKQGGELLVEVSRVRVRPPVDHGGAEGEHARISVRDAGGGVADENLPRIFEPFFTTKDVGEGTGLGLSITYGIMKEHGGWLDVQSERGKGSVFSLYFPPGRA